MSACDPIIATASCFDEFLASKNYIVGESLRLVAGLFFLQKSPELFDPVVLNKDKEKYQNAKDDETRRRIVDKAIRTGVRGYEIGRNIPTRAEIKKMREENEAALKNGKVAPHIRAGHLQTYWTKPGRCVPIIKYVQATFVNFKNIFDMPQGYYDKPKN